MRRFLRLFRSKSGDVVWLALLMPVFLLFLAMAVDGARLRLVREQLQVATDASALAGVLESYPEPVVERVVETDSNGQVTQIRENILEWRTVLPLGKAKEAATDIFKVNAGNWGWGLSPGDYGRAGVSVDPGFFEGWGDSSGSSPDLSSAWAEYHFRTNASVRGFFLPAAVDVAGRTFAGVAQELEKPGPGGFRLWDVLCSPLRMEFEAAARTKFRP